MAGKINPEESDLDRVARLIAELDGEEFLLQGLDPSPSRAASPEIEFALAAIREQRVRLEEELAEVWARNCNRC